MPNVLIIGATRGLGAALVQYYASLSDYNVYGTTRSSSAPSDSWSKGSNIHWLTSIDIASGPGASTSLAEQFANHKTNPKLHTLILTAGYFTTEQYGEANWDEQLKMYTLSSVAPVFVVQALDKAGVFVKNETKLAIVSSESGSIGLRHEKEGGGNYGHHASKTASNMVSKLLSLDLKEKGVGVVAVHPSFMRTEMTKGVGFDKFWDDGGALPPGEAAKILADWVETKFDLSKTGEYWAPRGTRDIGTWDVTQGKEVDGPVRLPW